MDNMDALGRDMEPEDVLDLTEPAIDTPPAIGGDERRLHVRAYNYWVSLLRDRPFPSVTDLDPDAVKDFARHSVLLDFTRDREAPTIAYLGGELRTECGFDSTMITVADVPARSLLSRLTDHYFQIIANRAPIGFEAEFVSQRGNNTMYRGILMPLSSDGAAIDFIYGVINWKEVADQDVAAELVLEMNQALADTPAAIDRPSVWADGPLAEGFVLADDELDGYDLADVAPLPADAGLNDRLASARDHVERLAAAEGRSRAALYGALSEAYDFHLAAQTDAEGYAEILAEAGIAKQARAPLTPVVKLVFGVGYDKTRLTEYAAALANAARNDVAAGGFVAFVEAAPGGIKGLVAAERQARRKPASGLDKGETARRLLRAAPPVARLSIDAPADEFVLLLARRDDSGDLAVIDALADQPALVDKAVRALAACRATPAGA